MSLGKCKECDEPLSSSARRCPHCGYDKLPVGRLAYAVTMGFILLVVWVLGSMYPGGMAFVRDVALGIGLLTLLLLYVGAR